MSTRRKISKPAVQQAVREDLLAWFAHHRREFPWRRNRTPYRVWVAEVMLQQTRADQAEPYYRRFIKAFPSVRALAVAPRRDVLKQWEGLGYYGRARRLHDTARYLSSTSGGRFPRTYEGLLALPGVGPYTAAAIASLAMGLDVAVVDGNVMRVLSRLLALKVDIATTRGRKRIQSWADRLLPPGRAGEFNEAMMELGALCCVPRTPGCGRCPVRTVCRAYLKGDPEAYPKKRKRGRVPHKIVGAGVVVNGRGEVLLAQREESDMLGGLWEFPGGTKARGESIEDCIVRELKEELGIVVRVGSRLTTVRHAYSHFTIELYACWARIRNGKPRPLQCADVAWVPVHAVREYPLSRADVKIAEELANQRCPM